VLIGRYTRWTENYAVAYEQHYSLAQFFSEDEDDKWLADHFYFNCMNVAIKDNDDGGQLRAEASINAGKVFESLGENSHVLVVYMSVLSRNRRIVNEMLRSNWCSVLPTASAYESNRLITINRCALLQGLL